MMCGAAPRLGSRTAAAPGELTLGGHDALALEPDEYRMRPLAPRPDAFVFASTLRLNVRRNAADTASPDAPLDEVVCGGPPSTM